MVGENRVVLYIPRVGVGAGKYVAKIVKNDRVVLITRVSSSSAFDLVGRGLGADAGRLPGRSQHGSSLQRLS